MTTIGARLRRWFDGGPWSEPSDPPVMDEEIILIRGHQAVRRINLTHYARVMRAREAA